LDARHDQHERIFKLSRDITIESKRAIFLLHRIQGSAPQMGLKMGFGLLISVDQC
jgi:predicted translin family RNA/ssDNA-binding protein